jgi:serine/threonine-protein kinase
MAANPYAPPRAIVEDRGDFEAPPDVLKKIKNAAVAGAISCGITLIVTALTLVNVNILGFMNAWQFLDVALIGGLAFGIYRKSRACAVIMLLYFIASKIMIVAATGRASGLVLAVVFLYYYALGVQGTFAYHKLRKEHLEYT